MVGRVVEVGRVGVAMYRVWTESVAGAGIVCLGVTVGSIQTDWVSVLVVAVRLAGCCLLYTSPSPRDRQKSRMPSSA